MQPATGWEMNGIGKQGVKLENRVGNEWNWETRSEIREQGGK